jgi:uncharacterized membrane protein YciS (DUF1049 family)
VATNLIVVARRMALGAIVLLFVLIAAVLAYVNQDPITLDIGLVRLDNASMTVILAVTFAAGAAFGGLFFALALLRHYRQRSALRRELRRVETELERLRGLPPPNDAD